MKYSIGVELEFIGVSDKYFTHGNFYKVVGHYSRGVRILNKNNVWIKVSLRVIKIYFEDDLLDIKVL